MAKLHFFYSTMNAGKSTALLQSNHNYLESDLNTVLFIPEAIAKKSSNKIFKIDSAQTWSQRYICKPVANLT